MECCEALSPQEQRIQDQIDGRGAGLRNGRERVFRILESFQGRQPRIDVERARYFTASMKRTEGQPLILRWAQAMKEVAQNISVYIDDDQLLVGRAGCPGRYGILYPELDGDFLDRAIEELPGREQSPFSIAGEDARIVCEEISPYWKGKTFHEDLNIALPEETHRLTYDDREGLESRFIVNETASFRSSLQWVHDYEKVLNKGFACLKQEALARIEALDPLSPLANLEQRPFLEAVSRSARRSCSGPGATQSSPPGRPSGNPTRSASRN